MSIKRITNYQKLVGSRVAGVLLSALLLLPAMNEAAAQCGDWDRVPTPNVGDKTNWLSAVTAFADNDAWAVGLWRDASGVFGPMAMRWNGTTWSLTDLPDTSFLGALPETAGVEAVSGGDVWVVGDVFVGYPYDNRPLVMRWRGGSWDYVDTVTLRPQTVYPFGPRGGLLYEVDALAPDDIWAVGQAAGYGDGGATTVPLAAHWDGSSWTDVEVPRVATRHHSLDDVVAISHDDVWAVGDYRNAAQAFHAVTYHWDGTQWSYVHNPIEDFPESGLDDVVATGPNDVWAIGGAPDTGVMLMHWDGNQWSLVQPPPNSGGSLAAVGPNDLWASGWNGFWHWDGSAWTEFPAAVPGATYVIRNGGMQIVGDCNIWCVGFWTLADGITGSTLAEKLTVGNTTTIVPDQFTVFRGQQIGGALEDVFESDDSRMRFNPGFTINSAEAPVWLIFDATLPSDNPASLEIVMESQAGTPGLTSTLEAWNWNRMDYDVVDVSSASFNSDTIVTADLSAGISDYAQAGTGDVRTRVGWRKTGFTINYPWEIRLDQLVWQVE